MSRTQEIHPAPHRLSANCIEVPLSVFNSLTKPKEDLPKAINNDKATPDLDASVSDPSANAPGSSKSQNEVSSSARQKLRSSICAKQSLLTAKEQSFLQSLADAPDVTDQVLDISRHVLEKDALYQNNAIHGDDEDYEDNAIIESLYGGKIKEDGEAPRRRHSIMEYRRRQSIVSVSIHRESILNNSGDLNISLHSETNNETNTLNVNNIKCQAMTSEDGELLHSVPPRDEPEIFGNDPSFRLQLWSITQKKEDKAQAEPSVIISHPCGEKKKKNGRRKSAHEFQNNFRHNLLIDSRDDEKEKLKITEISPQGMKSSIFGAWFAEGIDETFRNFFTIDCAANVSAHTLRSEGGDPEENMNEHTFTILGTSASDFDAMPHVMSPPLMDSLRPHMPHRIQKDNFWLKYSLVRDGASMHTLFDSVRNSTYTLTAIETTDGELFGAFTSSPWRSNGYNYFGSCEAFLWRVRQSRLTPCATAADQARLESDVEIYDWSGRNDNIQLSNQRMLIIGGGKLGDTEDGSASLDYGFGLALFGDLSCGTSSPCVTFDSPRLAKEAKDVFVISNVEIWTMTPVGTVEEAEKLEMARHFVFDHFNVFTREMKNEVLSSTTSRATVHS